MTDERKERCEACRYWDPAQGGMGLCRKNPPEILSSGTRTHGHWPETKPRDWCGAFQPLAENG